MKKSDTFASIMPKVIDIMATRRVFLPSSPSAEITAGGEGIAMSDEPAQQLRRQKNIPEFSPTAWGTVPPNVGFHSPRQGEISK